MNAPLKPWIARVVTDLRTFSADLLEVGLAKATVTTKNATHHSSTLQPTLRSAHLLCLSIPRLLEALESEDGLNVAEMVRTPTPRYARLSGHPGDYMVSDDGRVLPKGWLRPKLQPTLPTDALRWLLGIIQQREDRLMTQQARLTKQVETARFVRDGESEYAQMDIRSLDHMLESIRSAQSGLAGARAFVLRQAGYRLAPSTRMPYPFPKAAVWRSFRQEATSDSYGPVFLGAWLSHLFQEPIPVADTPYLYQRWCGLQIHLATLRGGWQTNSDVAGALFLGGPIEFNKGGARFTLWVEPRLGQLQASRIGWRSQESRRELTPDFLFVCGESGDRDAFVLDATLATSDEVKTLKGRYVDSLIGEDTRLVAGIPVLRRPLRAWAAAPVFTGHCQLGDSHGWTGIVPMNAMEQGFPGLEAWLDDVFQHAEHPTAVNV